MQGDWINDKLENWAKWLVERDSGGLGYPRRAAFVGLGGRSASTDRVPIDSVDASRTDVAVSRVRDSARHLWLVLMCRYLGDPSAKRGARKPLLWREVAQACFISEQEARTRFKEAKVAVGTALNRERQQLY